MTSRSDRQCFTFQRQASPKESSFRPMSIVCFSSRKRGRRTNGNFRFGRATFRSYGNIERPLPAQLSRPRTRSAMSAKRRYETSLRPSQMRNHIGHSPTVWRTDQLDPLLSFKIGLINVQKARERGPRLDQVRWV